MNKKKFKFEDDSVSPLWEYKKKYRDNDPLLNSESYFYDHRNYEKRK
jgi:hypothetical protein